MPAGIVLDTSFLITLADPARRYHAEARQYWQEFLTRGIPTYLPTIVVSEFSIKQEIPPEIRRACVVLPFNWDDAIQTAKLDFTKVHRGAGNRTSVKDDVKIIAQGIVKDAAWIITDDADTLFKWAEKLKREGKSKMRPIKLEDGFDPSFLEPDGQRKIAYDESQKDDENET
jgi:hypothetical protein